MRQVLNPVVRHVVSLARSLGEGWDAFWFTPADPTLLGLIRVLTGLMLLYTHAVWGLALREFYGPSAWLDERLIRAIQQESYACSFWWAVPDRWAWVAYALSML